MWYAWREYRVCLPWTGAGEKSLEQMRGLIRGALKEGVGQLVGVAGVIDAPDRFDESQTTPSLRCVLVCLVDS